MIHTDPDYAESSTAPGEAPAADNRLTFAHILRRSLVHRRARSLSALVALTVSAGVAAALLTLYAALDAKLHHEFRSFGANIVITAPTDAGFAPTAGARAERAAGHVTNALALFQNGDSTGGLAEAGIAVQANPDSAPGHYHRAALLALTGSNDEALPELEAAIRLEPKYKRQAKNDKDFDSLTSLPRFQELTGL